MPLFKKKPKTPPTTNSPAFRSVEHLPSSVVSPDDIDRRFSVSTHEPVPPLPHQHPAHSSLVHRSQSHRRPSNTFANTSGIPPSAVAPPCIVDADPSDQSWSPPPPVDRPDEQDNLRPFRRNLFSLRSTSPTPREPTGFVERNRSVRKLSPTPQRHEQRPLSVDTAADPHSASRSREYVVDPTGDPAKSPMLQEQSVPHEPRPPRSPQTPLIQRSNTDSTLLEHIYRPSPVESRHLTELAPGATGPQSQLGPRPLSRQSLGPPSPLPPPLAHPDLSASASAMSDHPSSGIQHGAGANPSPGSHASHLQGNNNQDRNNAGQHPDPDRSTPTPNRTRDEGEIDVRALIQKHDELQAKYSKVKRYYFEKEAQVQHLQNTVAHQRMAVSRTVLDDNEYANRFGRLDGAIKDLAFAFRKDWKSLPRWLVGYVNDDAHTIGTKEMTATGRAVISRWLVEELFERFFHPALEPTFSRQLKSIEMNLRRQQGKTITDEDKENAIARISNWRRTTLDGLADALLGPTADEYRSRLIDYLVGGLAATLTTYLGDSSPPGLDNGVRMIVENAVAIADKIPLESRDVCVEYILPGALLHEPNMKVETGLPPLANLSAESAAVRRSGDQDRFDGPPDDADGESSGSASQEGPPAGSHPGREPRMRSVFSTLMGRRPNHSFAPSPGGTGDACPSTMDDRNSMGTGRIRFASFVTAEVRGRGPMNVLVKAPVYLMD
ncbi:hypothetical protein BDV28DRAFT_4910 [Aspergillus coremiiformis]|uniref:S-adenosylmethionine-dependent methyltransferase-like protein n=1 Tax=Aspergillus coremiiformis TaxID=138285 RepID=A0A5N6Z886_9EURO|nr:hypothetical protein BDV28DRAFT_4910 [Aspergillus coremiiformis]